VDRRQLLLLPLAAIPAVGYARYVEPGWLEVTHETIQLPEITLGKTVRIVQLSDLHASEVVPLAFLEHAIGLALAQKPDLICITGDFITYGKGWEPASYSKILRKIPERVPCFASLGNHDGGWPTQWGNKPYSTEAVKKLLAASGLPLLFNASTTISVRSQTVRLVGLGDLWANDCLPQFAFREVPNDGLPTVVLSHNPDTKDLMPQYPWHLMLSGHTHGGQVVMPVLGLCPAPVQDRRYIKGLKPWNDRLIYVSAGVGNIDGVRFNCRPQVNVLDLVS
jgi:uncharacterized protein